MDPVWLRKKFNLFGLMVCFAPVRLRAPEFYASATIESRWSCHDLCNFGSRVLARSIDKTPRIVPGHTDQTALICIHRETNKWKSSDHWLPCREVLGPLEAKIINKQYWSVTTKLKYQLAHWLCRPNPEFAQTLSDLTFAINSAN